MRRRILSLAALSAVCVAGASFASSHREAPAITRTPTVDATDFYMFTSYEPGRDEFVTLVANYVPLQDAYGGPNYFALDPSARYEIKIDNDGDAIEDLTFRFESTIENRGIALEIGPEGDTRTVAIPLINAGPIGAGDVAALNRRESYTIDLVEGARPFGAGPTVSLTNAATGSSVFDKPVDNIGTKSIPDYASYAAAHVYDVVVPGCAQEGRVFVGQRKDPFVVNLGETFDLINIADPVGAPDAESDDLADKNVTSIVLELHESCVLAGDSTVIGAWTTASLPLDSRDAASSATGVPIFDVAFEGQQNAQRRYVQVSRLSNPLVNEVVIGLEDKDAFNRSAPRDDAQFLDYVTHPTLPALIELLFGVPAPTEFPRTDLIAAFLTGVEGLNRTATPSEMLRLNTAIAPTPRGSQSRLGVLGGDLAGFPNGRRPGDDVVDIALRVVMGALLPPEVAPAGSAPFTDGAYVDDAFFGDSFPYLLDPLAGSPSDAGTNRSTAASPSRRSLRGAPLGARTRR